jgi:hypothetical protein
MVLVPHKSGTLDPVLVWFLKKVQSWGFNQQFTTGFQKKKFKNFSSDSRTRFGFGSSFRTNVDDR